MVSGQGIQDLEVGSRSQTAYDEIFKVLVYGFIGFGGLRSRI